MMHRKTNHTFWGFAMFLTIGFLIVPMFSLAQDKVGHGMQEKSEIRKSAITSGKCPMCKMCRSMEHCTKTMAHLKNILVEAKSAAETEGAKTTLVKINEALELMARQCKHMEKKMMKMNGKKCPMCGKMMGRRKIINTRCPIMGTKLDPDKVPQDLTREWNGQKIGFCCAGCPQKWDKLSDEERQKKLEAAIDDSKEKELNTD